MPERACAVLSDALQSKRQALRSFLRETPAAVATDLRAPTGPAS